MDADLLVRGGPVWTGLADRPDARAVALRGGRVVALDSEAEAAIHDTLGEVMTGRTVIAIAHRLSTIAHLDRIVVLDAGRIVEQGTHAQLVERRGLYADLWARQSGGFLGTTGFTAGPAPRR